MILADKIILLRKKSGWSQEELADKMNVSRQSVSKWEGAQAVPDLNKILQLSNLFGVSTDYLLKDEIEEAQETQNIDDSEGIRRVSMDEANDFIKIKRETSSKIALSVFGCVISPVLMLILPVASEVGKLGISEDAAGGIGMITMILMLIAPIITFISCGNKTKRYSYLEEEVFETQYGVDGMVKERKKEYEDTYNRNNILGVCMCILSVIPLFAGAFFSKNDLLIVSMLCVMMTIAGIGAAILVNTGIIWASYQKLLQEDEYERKNKKRSPLMDAISGAYWLLTTAIYLLWSFKTNDWKNTWIVWPVAGVLYGAVCGVVSAIGKNKAG